MLRWKLLLLAIAILAVLAVKYLPWYALVGLILLFAVSARFLAGKLLRRLFSLPFRAKGAVLKNATATVHSVKSVPAPPAADSVNDDDEDSIESGKRRDYFLIEVTISPAVPDNPGPFQHWEVGELSLLHPEYDQMNDAPKEFANVAVVQSTEVQVQENFPLDNDDEDDDEGSRKVDRDVRRKVGDFVTDDGYKLPGQQRLRLLVGVNPCIRKLAFGYYFEKFGVVDLPSGSDSKVPIPPKRLRQVAGASA